MDSCACAAAGAKLPTGEPGESTHATSRSCTSLRGASRGGVPVGTAHWASSTAADVGSAAERGRKPSCEASPRVRKRCRFRTHATVSKKAATRAAAEAWRRGSVSAGASSRSTATAVSHCSAKTRPHGVDFNRLPHIVRSVLLTRLGALGAARTMCSHGALVLLPAALAQVVGRV
eukprot:scaffold132207_cov63-Phaeocystis_antarctica.AAC.2